jgi:hypothetical protein
MHGMAWHEPSSRKANKNFPAGTPRDFSIFGVVGRSFSPSFLPPYLPSVVSFVAGKKKM